MSSYLKIFKNWLGFQKNVYNTLGKGEIFRRLLREGNVRVGTLVGSDKYGNEYYENNFYFVGRNRFVKFPYKDRLTYDGSQIPPEWHRWMQHMTDDPPNKVPPIERKWMADHELNMSGTNQRYVPYSTTRPKIEQWEPPKNE